MPWGHKYLKLACLPFHHGCAFRQTIPKFDDSVKSPFQNFPLDPRRFAPSPRRNEHKGGEPPRTFTTAAIIPAWCARILPRRRDGRRPGLPARAPLPVAARHCPRWLTAHRPLCPFPEFFDTIRVTPILIFCSIPIRSYGCPPLFRPCLPPIF